MIRQVMFAVGFGLIFSTLAQPAMAVTISRVPELNPGSAASALTLLASGMALVFARRRR